jgi:hypothetical protein
MSALEPIAGIFARTAENVLAARVDDLAWLAVPVDGGIKIATAWRLDKPLPEWTRTDFHSADGVVADEGAFQAHVQVIAEHRRQSAALKRGNIALKVETPWGWPDHSVRYAEGIASYSTPSHGGFHVDAERLATMPAALRNGDGWYEEDGEWAKVATAFPDLFTDYEREHAERTLRDWMPDAWEAVYGRKLDPSESFVRDRQHFEAEHANDWVVISASRSDDHPGQVECAATRGGQRGHVQVRKFLVPRDEYSIGRHGFVIDESRHPSF